MSPTRPTGARRNLPHLVVLLATFAGGVFLERNGWIPGRGDRLFQEAYARVRDHFVDRSRLDGPELNQGAIRGMIASLGDTGHTTYLTPEERKRTNEELSGKMEGIGARLSLRQRKPTIAVTMPKSPARTAGLKSGDVILRVDGEQVEALTLSKVVEKVRGPAGTSVKLEVQREGSQAPLNFTVERAHVEVPEVSWHLLPGEPQLAHVVLQRFSKESGKQMKAALEEIKERGVRGIVLDIRGNVGGYKQQCIEVGSQFLREGTVLFVQIDARGKEEEIKAEKDGVAHDLPVVCLIDRNSASSSEILAGALQDHERARLVGTKTFGTGTVLREYPLSDGSAVRLAVYQWLTPLRRQIWHKGISPDEGLEVPMPAEGVITVADPDTPLSEAALKRNNDAPLARGMEVLRKEIARRGEP